MTWWNKTALLKRQLKDVQTELEKEQGKASRLTGFLSRLQSFGVSPTGDVPKRAFAEALMDTVHILLKMEQAALLVSDPETLELVPTATLGFPPQAMARMRM